MKRAAAIVGPTPSFVRWAIIQDCRYRVPVDDDIPYQVFRQLRTLREASVCQNEGRVVDEVCIHGEFNQDAESARGFPLAEVGEIFGDLNLVASTCSQCPANACQSSDALDLWAGCYGWFFSKVDKVDFVDAFQREHANRPETFESFATAASAWFSVWQTSWWQGQALGPLLDIVQNLISGTDTTLDFQNFARAVELCRKNDLVLVSELVPAGHSDGIHWKIEPHCSICHNEMGAREKQCRQCGCRSGPTGQIKRKVLGLRPYMVLKSIYGLDRTNEILSSFSRRSVQ